MSSLSNRKDRGDQTAAYTYANCDVHDGEIEYPDSGCAKCRGESETGGVLPNGNAGVILKHAADTR